MDSLRYRWRSLKRQMWGPSRCAVAQRIDLKFAPSISRAN
jgi:hypothetical protein